MTGRRHLPLPIGTRAHRPGDSGWSRDLIALGNQAANGARVSPSAVEWALDTSPLIFELLDGLIGSRSNDWGTN